MTVAGLRSLLTQKGLDISGRKPVLVQRLLEAENGNGYVSSIKVEQNSADLAPPTPDTAEGKGPGPSIGKRRLATMPSPVVPGILSIASINASCDDRLGAVELAVASPEVRRASCVLLWSGLNGKSSCTTQSHRLVNQDAMMEKLKAGEKLDVEHVALATDSTEALARSRRVPKRTRA